MSESDIFRCRTCQQIVGNPYMTLDRNTQQFTTGRRKGKRQDCIQFLSVQEMFRSGSQACRAQHEAHAEPMVACRQWLHIHRLGSWQCRLDEDHLVTNFTENWLCPASLMHAVYRMLNAKAL